MWGPTALSRGQMGPALSPCLFIFFGAARRFGREVHEDVCSSSVACRLGAPGGGLVRAVRAVVVPRGRLVG